MDKSPYLSKFFAIFGIVKKSDIWTLLCNVYCKMKLPKVEKQNWTLLQVHFGQSCKGDF